MLCPKGDLSIIFSVQCKVCKSDKMKHQRIVVSILSLVINFLSMTFSYLFNFDAEPELINLLSGSLLISTSLFQIFPASVEFISTGYPYYALIMVITFAFLTLFNFIRDAISLMDDNVLIPCDAINLQATFTDYDQSNSAAKSQQKFVFKENFVECFYYFVFVLESFPCGNAICNMSPEKAMFKLVSRIFEFIILGKILRKMNLSSKMYWLLSSIACIIQPITMFISVDKHSTEIRWVYLSFSSTLFGTYLFFAAKSINEGIVVTDHSTLLVTLVFLSGILIPALIKIGC